MKKFGNFLRNAMIWWKSLSKVTFLCVVFGHQHSTSGKFLCPILGQFGYCESNKHFALRLGKSLGKSVRESVATDLLEHLTPKSIFLPCFTFLGHHPPIPFDLKMLRMPKSSKNWVESRPFFLKGNLKMTKMTQKWPKNDLKTT